MFRMYSISFPIHVHQAGPASFCMPAGLARDILAHLRYEPALNIICPVAPSRADVPSPVDLNLADHPGLTVTLLPYSGRRSYYLGIIKIVRILARAAGAASVWHTGCSTRLFDLTTLSFLVGRWRARKLRVLCLDSDPASMLANSAPWKRWMAPLVRARYRRWAGEADATVFVGSGTAATYGPYCRRSVTTAAVWLNEGDLASADLTAAKFDQPAGDVVRLAVPTRLQQWKGVDDVLAALSAARDRLPAWHLDVIGDGPMKAALIEQARPLGDRVSFLGEIPYGEPFFARLRSYHVVMVPTRGLEEARIAYDAAASGCVLLHSATPTLEQAMRDVATRWRFQPGNVEDLVGTLETLFARRGTWRAAALQGLEAMRGRTIEDMHKMRSSFLGPIRSTRSDGIAAAPRDQMT
jgi:glycosyltransferase involved in cell wall biosynthesis